MTVAPSLLSPIGAAYRSHGHHVLRRAMKFLGNEADAGDVAQEVFLSLLAAPEQFGGRSSLTTWLYAATTNLCLNRLRDGRLRARLVAQRGESTPFASSPTQPEDAVELRRLLVRLPEDLARVAVYYFGDEMTQDEIASVMSCSRRHVVNLIDRLAKAVHDLETAPPASDEPSS